MERQEFERQVFGDTAPRTEIDYDFYRRRAAQERRAVIAALPRQMREALDRAWSASSRLRQKFMRMRADATRHQDLRAEDAGNAGRRA